MSSPSTADSKIVLITGASSGIGEATARRLAADGHHVVLGARRVDRLEALAGEIRTAGGRADHGELDVTSLDSVRAFAETAHERHGRIDVLVNNAGVMPLSTIDALRVDEWNQMIDVNLRGTLYGIAAVLPHMRARGAGHIVNVASTSAHRVDPTAAVYCATKYAVRALSEGLRQESRDIRVTVVSPGFTRSELTDHGGDPETQAVARAAMEQFAIPASAVADAIGYAIGRPGDVDVNELVVRPTAQG
ncbi:NADP-dependent 3-hydroxy acid dehydrogenase YdfG [Streptosporangium subroseum]|uniref:NADP-dependent 3-hydroxy acid dehydrogenase YdfG n=1 Tax=Streptosporangium subroseum TaxID=106412 RepID=A0A239F255_9ACTN|nr:SDR family oxidoreductase [Streptosporangium subroseum]SNS50628.1 NADP-dependent 3-hydroxy acid dehydrogenase YdfG [Streptosporangium subroseum]